MGVGCMPERMVRAVLAACTDWTRPCNFFMRAMLSLFCRVAALTKLLSRCPAPQEEVAKFKQQYSAAPAASGPTKWPRFAGGCTCSLGRWAHASAAAAPSVHHLQLSPSRFLLPASPGQPLSRPPSHAPASITSLPCHPCASPQSL